MPDETYSEAQTERLFKATLRKMLRTPQQPHEAAAGKKHKAKRKRSPSSVNSRNGRAR